MSRVIVTAFWLPRMTANRNSFQVPIRIRIAAAAMPGRAAGMVTRNRVPRREQPSIRAARSSETGHLQEEVAQQPDDQRQPERDVDDDQRRDGVGEAQDLEDPQHRDGHDDRRAPSGRRSGRARIVDLPGSSKRARA